MADYVAAFRRRGRLFLLISLPILIIAAGTALTLPDQFRSSARIAINLEGANVNTLEPIQVAGYADQYVAELRERVMSRANLLPFVQDPGVFPQSEEELPLAERTGMLKGGFAFSLETQPVISLSGRELDITSGFQVGFAGPDPDFAFKAARFFSESFLKEDRKSRTERASSTYDFLKKQIGETETQIANYEQEVADFKVQNACCLPELKDLNMGVIQRSERDIEGLAPRIRTLEQDRVFLQNELEEIRKQSVSTDRLTSLEQEYVRLVASYGPDHPDVMRVRREIQAITNMGPIVGGQSELTMLRIELAEAERKYSDLHPDVINLKRRIEALEADQPSAAKVEQNRLIENPRYLQLRSGINAIDTELGELRRRGPELRDKIEEYEERLVRTPQIESEYLALSRKLESARDNYDNLQRRLASARQTEALESAEIGARLNEISQASLPNSPSGPPRLGIFIVGVFLAVSIGVGSVIFAEMVDATIRGSKDIFRVMETVPIATIPVIQNSGTRAASRRRLILMSSLSLAIAVAIAYVLVSNIA